MAAFRSDHSLYNYVLSLADNSLIMGHRLSEWTGHGPTLEQDIAITNIALDYIGQSRFFYQYAAQLLNAEKNSNYTEDDLAYLRDAGDFKNLLMVELPNGDWSYTILKLFFFANYQYLLYSELQQSNDAELAAAAEKSLKEVRYHLRWSGEWAKRLGAGTPESRKRIEASLQDLWPYTGEFFKETVFEKEVSENRLGVAVSNLQYSWIEKTKEIFNDAFLVVPSSDIWMHQGGKNGVHTEHLGYLLAEMQFLQRAYPGCEW